MEIGSNLAQSLMVLTAAVVAIAAFYLATKG